MPLIVVRVTPIFRRVACHGSDSVTRRRSSSVVSAGMIDSTKIQRQLTPRAVIIR
jgi:hypothetical protein